MTEYIYIYIYIYQSILKMGLANFIWILSVFCNYDTTPLYQQNNTFIYATEKLISKSCAQVRISCARHKIFHLHVPLGAPYFSGKNISVFDGSIISLAWQLQEG